MESKMVKSQQTRVDEKAVTTSEERSNLSNLWDVRSVSQLYDHQAHYFLHLSEMKT